VYSDELLTGCPVTTQRRSYSFAEYWKHFLARLNGVHAFGYNSDGSEPIWIKFGAIRVHCLGLALADFGRDLRRSESERASRNFLSGKQRTISPTSVGPNFTKFAHKTWIREAVNPFCANFLKISPYGVFFSKRQLFRKNSP